MDNMTDLAKRTLERAAAAAFLPVKEHPPGSNSGPEVDQYQAFTHNRPGAPWCASFATYQIHRAAKDLGIKSEFPITGSSSAIYRWAKKTGNLLAAPEEGCIGLIRGGSTGFEHTYLVDKIDKREGLVRTIDGNWGSAVRHSEHLIRTSIFVKIV